MARTLMEKNGVEVAVLRPVDDDITYGVGPAIRTHGGPNDALPGMLEKVLAAQLLVVASSISWVRFLEAGLCVAGDQKGTPCGGDQKGYGQSRAITHVKSMVFS